MTKLILDCDTGIDDALALAYLCACDETQLIGITTVFGNIDVSQATKNTKDILKLLGKTNIPVVEGAPHASRETTYQQQRGGDVFHGKNGIGNVHLEMNSQDTFEISAEDFLIEHASPEHVLVATGPLTNIANAWVKNPERMRMFGRIVIMGGAFGVSGNVSPSAEANISQDAYAAKIVFESGIPCVMIGLDVTSRAIITRREIETWKQSTSVLKTLYDISDHYFKAHELIYPQWGGAAMHDVLASMVAIHPEHVKTLTIPLTVSLDERDRGRTVLNLSQMSESSSWTTSVAYDLDVSLFKNVFLKRLKSYA